MGSANESSHQEVAVQTVSTEKNGSSSITETLHQVAAEHARSPGSEQNGTAANLSEFLQGPWPGAASMRVACENPGYANFPYSKLSTEGVCYGKVRMGYGSTWTSWRQTWGQFSCSNRFFGRDPVRGQAKECICEPDQNPMRVACENPGYFNYPGCKLSTEGVCYGKVRMGFGSTWTPWRQTWGQFSCSNRFFGKDPVPGQAKECICEVARQR